jgi:hypothetical protein
VHLRIIQLLVSIGLILSIVGGTNISTKADGSIKIATESKAGIILYFAAFIACIVVCILSLPRLGWVPQEERLLAVGVLLAFPFIFVRLLYSVLSFFLHSHSFSIYNGSVAVDVGMAVVEEFIVVLIYLFLGLKLSKLALGPGGPVLSKRSKEDKHQSHRKTRRTSPGEHEGRHHSRHSEGPQA